MFRYLVIACDFAVLVILIIAVAQDAPRKASGVLIVSAVFALVIANIFCIWTSCKQTYNKCWPFIVIKRKTLEEEKRIRELEEEKNNIDI